MKSALIMMGGGMRSAHGAGFLDALQRDFARTPDILIGTSGNSGNVCYFTAGQTEALRAIWCDLMPRLRIANPWRLWKVFDVDSLVRSIFEEMPLDLSAIEQSPIDLLIPVTDAETGDTTYRRPTRLDAAQVLRAAMAIPVLYGRRIYIGGRPLIDGEVGPALEDHVREAMQRGATRILVVNHGWPDNALRLALKHVVARLEPHGLRVHMQHDFAAQNFVCMTGPAGVRVSCIFPTDVPARFIERSPSRLAQTIDAGRSCAHEHVAEIEATFG